MKKKILIFISLSFAYFGVSAGIIQVVDIFINRLTGQETARAIFIVEICVLALGYILYLVISMIKGRSIFAIIAQARKNKNNLHNVPYYESHYYNKRTISHVARSLLSHRVTTLRGCGGIGKTRTIVESSRRVNDNWDCVFFFECESADSYDELVSIFTLQLGEFLHVKGENLNEYFLYLKKLHSALFIFDNCEQAVTAFKDLATLILQNTDNISLAFTSRVSIGLEQEHVIDMPALAVDSLFSGGCRLFIKTAGVKPNKSNSKLILEICQRLEGLPLALTIVANRVKVMGIETVHGNLDGIIGSANGELNGRHETLYNCLMWSYDLLNVDEKRLLQIMALYQSLIPVASICQVIESADISADYLEVICNRGFAYTEENNKTMYYRLPAMVRGFLKSVNEEFDADRYMELICAWYAENMSLSERRIFSTDAHLYLSVIDNEYPNIISVLDFCLKHRLDELLIKFTHLYWYCFLRGRWMDFKEIFNRPSQGISEQYVGQLYLANGALEWSRSDLGKAEEHLQQAIECFNQSDNVWGKGQALHLLGHVYHQMGRIDDADEVFAAAYTILHTIDPEYWDALLLNDLAEIKLDTLELPDAIDLLNTAKIKSQKTREEHSLGNSLMHLGTAYTLEHKFAKAKSCYTKALKVFGSINYLRGIGSCRRGLGELYMAWGKTSRAGRALVDAITIQTQIVHRIGLVRTIESTAKYLMKKNDPENSFVLCEFCRTFRIDEHMDVVGYQKSEMDDLYKRLCERLPDKITNELKSIWAKMDLLQASDKAKTLLIGA